MMCHPGRGILSPCPVTERKKMTPDPHTLYKLIVLYMLSRVDFPLTRTQISDFVLEKGYTNFLTMQQVFDELTEADMIIPNTIRNRTQLTLTKEGSQALRYFESRISDEIKSEIESYLKENQMTLRDETSILADYYKSTTGEYEARLQILEKTVPLMELTLSVPDETIASNLCDNWMKSYDEIYQYVINKLL